MAAEYPGQNMILLAARSRRRDKQEWEFRPVEQTPYGGLLIAQQYPRAGPAICIIENANSLVAVLGGAVAANQPHYVVYYSEVTETSMEEAQSEGAFNSATPVVLVPTPNVNYKRMIHSIFVCNQDTALVNLSLYVNVGSTPRYLLRTWPLPTGHSLIWTPQVFQIA